MKSKKIMAVIMASFLALSIVGCGEKTKNVSSSAKIDPDASYPLQTDEVLTIWTGGTSGLSKYTSAEEYPYTKALEKATGVKLKFVYAPQGQTEERLKIMLASGDVTDIIEYNWWSYPGGPEKVISEGHITPLNDLLDKYAKNFKKILDENPDIDKLAKTTGGDYYTFPQIRSDEKMNTAYGPIIRKDWLDDLGLPLPETLEDWYITLKAFKEKKNAKNPMIVHFADLEACGMFFSANGVKPGFYREGKTVKYGPLEKGYKETLIYLNKLYKEGLLGENITNVSTDERNALMLNHNAGAAIGWLNSSIKNWQNNSAVAGTSFNLSATKYAVLNKGEVAKFGYRDESIYPKQSISMASTKKELAAKFIDYTYTEQGGMLANYGIEGTSYVMKDGKPKYTDLILKNPEGLSTSQALSLYTGSLSISPSVYTLDAMMQINETDRQKNAIDCWSQTDAKTYNLPHISISNDLTNEYSKIYSDIKTYTENMFYRFVMGLEPMENYDNYVQQLKKMKIDRAIEINQKALNDFNNN